MNDNAPFLREPKSVTIQENLPPQEVARIEFDDLDDWSRGYGPPFSVQLDAHAPPYIPSSVQVSYESSK